MRLLRRAALSLGVAVSVAASLTIATVGAAGGFGEGGGTFTFSDTSGIADSFNPIDQSSINLNVDRSTFLIRQRPAGVPQMQTMTTLFVTRFIPPTGPGLPPTISSTCLVIPDSDFTVSPDLQKSTLVVLNDSNECPFFKAPVSGAAIDVKAGGGGGGGSTIPLPLSVNITWAGTGAVGESTTNGSFHCLTFVAITHDNSQQALSASVNGSITANGSPFASFSGGRTSGVFGIVRTDKSIQNVAGQGILPPACGGKGGG